MYPPATDPMLDSSLIQDKVEPPKSRSLRGQFSRRCKAGALKSLHVLGEVPGGFSPLAGPGIPAYNVNIPVQSCKNLSRATERVDCLNLQFLNILG